MKISSQHLLTKAPPGRWAVALAVIVFLVLSALLLANAMNKPPSRDEQMYCTAGVLMAQGQTIYRDFSYVSQLPYHPLLLASVYRTLGTTRYLLVARLITVLCEILTLVCVWAICQHLLREFPRMGLLLGVAAMIFYAANPLVYMANGYAWNHGVVVFLVVLSAYLFLTCPLEHHSPYRRSFLIGVLLTVATCMRITTALIHLVFVIMIFTAHNTSKRRAGVSVLSYLAASALVSVWPLYTIARAGGSFRVNLIEIPRIYGDYLRGSGASHGKLEMALACLIQPGYLALLVAVGFLWWQARKTAPASALAKNQTLLRLLCASSFVIAFIPPTLWRQYLAVPVPFLCLLLAVPFRRLCQNAAPNSRPFQRGLQVTAACVLATVTFQLITVLRHAPQFGLSHWEPLKVHRISQTIAQAIQETGPVLTLAPLYALEGGRPIYPELSCGSIVFRIGDLMSPQQRNQTHTVGPSTLTDLIKRDRPSAILLGVETAGYEAALRNIADPAWQSLNLDNDLELRLPAQ